MIKSTIDFEVPKFPFSIDYSDELLFLGSCFSDTISAKALYYGFDALSNPFGTIFHPIPIARNIKNALLENELDSDKILNNRDLYFTYETSSLIYGYSIDELKEVYQNQLKLLKEKLLNSKVIFITFGTSWAYYLSNSEFITANCHKQPNDLFHKKLVLADELYTEWKEILGTIKAYNSDVKFVFTVSPVRHIKDGIVENNWSKSQLIELCRKLTQLENCYYFPSYEIVIDELRDYRYYNIDKIHPNEEAINYIWSRFQASFFSDETVKIQKEIEKIKKSIEHKSLFEKSQSFIEFKDSLNKKIELFKKNFPKVNLGL